MKTKKFLSLVVSCALCFTAVFATGCNDDNAPAPTTVIERLEMEDTNLMLTLGDSAELSVSYNELSGETLVWTSSAPKVVSVDQNGNVNALKVGTATITATYGSKQASCKVEVGLSDNAPILVFGDSVDEEITLLKNSTYDLGVRVQFNGKRFDDGAIEYYVADESVGTIEDGKFVAKDVAGSTQVSVYATWRGQTVHAKTIQVNVITESTVLLNDGKLMAMDLYMAESHEGVSYATSQTISSIYVSQDATQITDYSLSIADDRIATIEQTDDGWVVSAKKAGKTNLLVSFGGQEFPFAITVNRPVKALDLVVDFSISDEKCWIGNAFKGVDELIDGLTEVVSYSIDGVERPIKNGTPSFAVGDNQLVTLYNDSVGYQVTMNVYDTVIDDLQDFVKIYAGATATDLKGAYALGKDIIEPKTVLSMPAGMVENNFAGTFDGKGHVLSFSIDNGAKTRFGLFGKYLKGAVIKNVALNDVTLNGSAYADPAGAIAYESLGDYSTIENVFVNVKFSGVGTNNLAFMHNVGWATILKNIIVHAPEVPVNTEGTYGSFSRGQGVSAENSYVISPAPLYVTTKPTNFTNNLPKLYASYASLKSAGHDYSSFNAEYWDVTTYGVPVWKALVSDFAF